MVSQRLGAYEIVIPIENGDRAEVHLGRKIGAEDYVAIRIPKRATTYNVDKTLLRLRHEHIVDVLDAGRTDEGSFVVQEYVPGISLSGLKVEMPDLPRGIAMRALLDALFGLHALHEHARLVHRDFATKNILIGTDGIGRLVVGLEPSSTDQPEAPRDPSTDIRAAAIVVWEILAERAVSAAVPPRLRDVAQGVNAELDDVVAKALLLDRAARTSDARRFGEALAAAAESCGLLADYATVARLVERITAKTLRERKERLQAARRDQQTRPPSMPDVRTLIGAAGPPTSKRQPLPSLPDAPTTGDGQSDLRIAVSLAKSGERADAELVGLSQAPPPPPEEEPEVYRSPVVVEPTGIRGIIKRMTPTQWSLFTAAVGFFVGFLVLLAALRSKPAKPNPIASAPKAVAAAPAALPAPAPTEPPAPDIEEVVSIDVTANARIASLRIGDRSIDSVVPAPTVAVDLIGNEATGPLQITATSVDGRTASVTAPAGAHSAALTFPERAGKKPAPASTTKHPWSKRGK